MNKKLRNHIIKTVIPFLGVTLLTGCQTESSTETTPETLLASASHKTALSESFHIKDRKNCPLNELFDYLNEEGAGIPFAYAKIIITINDTDNAEPAEAAPESDSEFRQDIIDMNGVADISWQTFQTSEEFQNHLSALKSSEDILSGTKGANTLEFAYYQHQLEDDVHAIDLDRFLKERYDKEDNPLYAIVLDERPDPCSYCFSQSDRRKQEWVVKDNVLYKLEYMGVEDGSTRADINALLIAYTTRMQKVKEYNGWVIGEEALYWIDHDERITSLENPTRVFTEVKGKDNTWEDTLDVVNFALLKEADYQIRVCEDGPLLQLHFRFAEEIPSGGYEAYFFNGSCADEDYEMTVIDLATNELLQNQQVQMSIEIPDMITFTDLDEDGYLDIQIDHPSHWNGSRAEIDEYSSQTYMLWNPAKSVFEDKSGREVAESLMKNQEAAFTEYVVQPGDTLWGISRRFYGTGSRYTKIEEINIEILSSNKYLMPGMVLKIP